MKCGLFSRHPSYRFPDPFQRKLVANMGYQLRVVRDLFIQLVAFCAHTSLLC